MSRYDVNIFGNSYKMGGWTIAAVIGLFIVLAFVEPAFWLGIGYVSGWIAKITVGTQCVTALNTAFGTEFTADMLPWIGAALAWVGSFFKRSNASAKKSN